jgi:hypothetical protein
MLETALEGTATMTKRDDVCEDCGKPAEIGPPVCRAFLCYKCLGRRVNSPHNVAMMERDEFIDEGGKLN